MSRPTESQIIEAIGRALREISDPNETYSVEVDAINGRAILKVMYRDDGEHRYAIHVFAQ